MPDAQPRVSLLESLRARSAAARNVDTPQRETRADELRDIDRRLTSAFRWLDEALTHLGAIRPVVEHCFALGAALAIAAPRFDGGFVASRRRQRAGLDLVERVELFYRMSNGSPLRFEVPQAAVSELCERLRAAQLEFDYRMRSDAPRATPACLFTVAPVVRASVLFRPDYDRRVVMTTLRNVDRLETVTLDFAPAIIGESALEDLVRLMLGESNAFLKRAPLEGVGVRTAA